MEHKVKIISVKHLTHNVLEIVTEKPADFNFIAGQAADISLPKPGWETELRPFTFTSLAGADHLEFIIKTYPSHNGVTQQLLSLAKDDELIVHDVFGDINYKGEGIFIAGGAGITPFVAILRQLEKDNQVGNNKLIFANKTKADIILEDKFQKLLGYNFINVLSGEKYPGYEEGYITADLIEKLTGDDGKYFYLCGPEPMMDAVEKQLASLGIPNKFIIKEAY